MGNIEIFDSIAEQYDTDERIKIARLIAETIRSHVAADKDFAPSRIAIDYGCGSGLTGMELVNVFGTVILIDASANMITRTNQKIREAGIKNAKTMCCDFLGEYPRDLHADYIILSQVLLHIKEVEAVLTQIYKILNKGGHLIIVDFDKNEAVISDQVHNGFDQETLINTVINTGFTNPEARTFHHAQKIFMKQDASLFLLDAVKQ